MIHLTAIWRFRHFLLALVRLDLRLRYKRSVLGIGWSLLNPISMTFVFAVVFSNLLGAEPRKYVPFLLLGMAVWGFVRECALTGANAMIGNEAYIRQSPLPYGLYPLRVVFGQAIHSSITLAVALAAVVILAESFAPLAMFWAVGPVLLLFLVFGWAVATIASVVNVYVRDTAQFLEIGAQVLFFLTPVMYPAEILTRKGLSWLLRINPVNLFLELIRAPFITGQPADAKQYAYAVLLTVASVVVAGLTLSRLQKRLIFHL